jgi:hypothetical protein
LSTRADALDKFVHDGELYLPKQSEFLEKNKKYSDDMKKVSDQAAENAKNHPGFTGNTWVSHWGQYWKSYKSAVLTNLLGSTAVGFAVAGAPDMAKLFGASALLTGGITTGKNKYRQAQESGRGKAESVAYGLTHSLLGGLGAVGGGLATSAIGGGGIAGWTDLVPDQNRSKSGKPKIPEPPKPEVAPKNEAVAAQNSELPKAPEIVPDIKRPPVEPDVAPKPVPDIELGEIPQKPKDQEKGKDTTNDGDKGRGDDGGHGGNGGNGGRGGGGGGVNIGRDSFNDINNAGGTINTDDHSIGGDGNSYDLRGATIIQQYNMGPGIQNPPHVQYARDENNIEDAEFTEVADEQTIVPVQEFRQLGQRVLITPAPEPTPEPVPEIRALPPHENAKILDITRANAKKLDELPVRIAEIDEKLGAPGLQSREAADLQRRRKDLEQELRTLKNKLGRPDDETLEIAKADAYRRYDLEKAQDELDNVEKDIAGYEEHKDNRTSFEGKELNAKQQELQNRVLDLEPPLDAEYIKPVPYEPNNSDELDKRTEKLLNADKRVTAKNNNRGKTSVLATGEMTAAEFAKRFKLGAGTEII